MLFPDIRCDLELYNVARLFFGDDVPMISLDKNDDEYIITCDGQSQKLRYNRVDFAVMGERFDSRILKLALYDALSAFTGRKMPWGALTGVRPTKLFYECLNTYNDSACAVGAMREVYRISDKRAAVLADIAAAQSGKIHYPEEYINLYIHIPFCASKCSYCSFISVPTYKTEKLRARYVELLCREISSSIDLIKSSGYKILSVYVGGGTPTALSLDELSAVLESINVTNCEYTCEAGRPDTITMENLKIMKQRGVNRVCVNPQSLSQKTLNAIGRSHTVDMFYAAYGMAKQFDFAINCDLIAGLPDESLSDFVHSFNGIMALKPDNITVHSLAKKNGSGLRYDKTENALTADMLDYALDNRGQYIPYYLYRQKRAACNLENIGFTILGHECINNITTMEETVSVMACGAGAISKTISNGDITRFANLRDVSQYNDRFDERLTAKLEFFKKVLHSR